MITSYHGNQIDYTVAISLKKHSIDIPKGTKVNVSEEF